MNDVTIPTAPAIHVWEVSPREAKPRKEDSQPIRCSYRIIGAAQRPASIARRARDAVEQCEPEVSLADRSIEEENF